PVTWVIRNRSPIALADKADSGPVLLTGKSLGTRAGARQHLAERSGAGIRGSGGGGEGDGVAEGLQLADVVAGLAVFVDAAGRGAGPEVAEAGGAAGEQVPDDAQNGAGHGDQGLQLAAALDDPPVALAEEGVGAGGRGGGLAEGTLEVGVALAGLAA